jgi:hypothetical protein
MLPCRAAFQVVWHLNRCMIRWLKRRRKPMRHSLNRLRTCINSNNNNSNNSSSNKPPLLMQLHMVYTHSSIIFNTLVLKWEAACPGQYLPRRRSMGTCSLTHTWGCPIKSVDEWVALNLIQLFWDSEFRCMQPLTQSSSFFNLFSCFDS